MSITLWLFCMFFCSSVSFAHNSETFEKLSSVFQENSPQVALNIIFDDKIESPGQEPVQEAIIAPGFATKPAPSFSPAAIPAG